MVGKPIEGRRAVRPIAGRVSPLAGRHEAERLIARRGEASASRSSGEKAEEVSAYFGQRPKAKLLAWVASTASGNGGKEPNDGLGDAPPIGHPFGLASLKRGYAPILRVGARRERG